MSVAQYVCHYRSQERRLRHHQNALHHVYNRQFNGQVMRITVDTGHALVYYHYQWSTGGRSENTEVHARRSCNRYREVNEPLTTLYTIRLITIISLIHGDVDSFRPVSETSQWSMAYWQVTTVNWHRRQILIIINTLDNTSRRIWLYHNYTCNNARSLMIIPWLHCG